MNIDPANFRLTVDYLPTIVVISLLLMDFAYAEMAKEKRAILYSSCLLLLIPYFLKTQSLPMAEAFKYANAGIVVAIWGYTLWRNIPKIKRGELTYRKSLLQSIREAREKAANKRK